MHKYILIGIALITCWYFFGHTEKVILGAGALAPKAPQQIPVNIPAFTFKNHQITPLAEFEIKAKVLSRKNYTLDAIADLVPTDLALGWGNMSDERIVNDFNISQSNRWYYFRTHTDLISVHEAHNSSANMHIIPGNDLVEIRLKRVKMGEIINIKGYLVKVAAPDGRTYISSLSREDTGAGACEIILVADLWTDYY